MLAWPREEALDEALARELAPGQARLLGEDDLTWGALLDRVARPARPLDPLIERLALWRAAERAAPGARGLVSALSRFARGCERAGVSPAEAVQAAEACTGGAGARLRTLAAGYARFCELVAEHGATRDRRTGLAAWRLGQREPLWLDGQHVRLLSRLDWDAADVNAAIALAARGCRVELELPWAAGRPEIYGGVEPLLAAIEARGDLATLELSLVDLAEQAAPALAGVVRALHDGGTSRAPAGNGAAALEIVEAPGPAAELRALAARARARVDAGAAPEDVAIAARHPDALSAPLAHELARVGLELDDRRGPTLDRSPILRLAAALVELPARGFPREDTLELLLSSYVDQGGHTGDARRLARAARERGVRELAPGGDGLALMPAVTPPALAILAALPARAAPGDHAAALAGALPALGVARRARTLDPGLAGADPGSTRARVEQALARDQAALAALDDLLAALPAAARAVGWTGAMAGDAFAALLRDLAGTVRLRKIGARGGAIRLCRLTDLAARRFEHVMIPRLLDGEAPARARDDGLLGERERRAFDRALGRRALPTGGPAGDATPFETLALVHALATARATVTLSYPAAQAGQDTLRSRFVDAVVRAAPWAPVTRLAASPVPSLGEARAPGDRLARVVLERLADPRGRLPAGGGASPLATERAHREVAAAFAARLTRVEALAEIERERWRFAAGEGPPGPHCGELGGVPGLAARVGGDAARPLSAGALDRLANCGFQFFAARVLRVDESEDGDDAPAATEVGSLAHRCLQVFYEERARDGRVPLRGDDDDRAALDGACARGFADAAAEGRAGHPVLWELRERRLTTELWRLVAREARAGTPGGGVPRHFELAFGMNAPGALPAWVCGDGPGTVHVCGRIDRVDVVGGGESAVVLDYKLGRVQALTARLAPGVAGVHQLQLPIYAAAARAGLAARGELGAGAPVDGALVSIQSGAATRLLGETLGDASEDALGDALAARVTSLVAGARAGSLPVAPWSCSFCPFRAACRVVVPQDQGEPA